jgi:hypothetical protein
MRTTQALSSSVALAQAARPLIAYMSSGSDAGASRVCKCATQNTAQRRKRYNATCNGYSGRAYKVSTKILT